MTASAALTPKPADEAGSYRIGVNLTWLVPGVVGGSEEYSIRLLEGLVSEIQAGTAVRLYGRADLFAAYPGLGESHELVAMPGQPGSRLRRIVLEQTWLAEVSHEDQVVHHMGGTVPLRSPSPGQRTVVTIHDLQPLEMPLNFSRPKRLWLNRMIPRAVHRADHVVCPSRFTAERIAALLSVPRSRITVVPHGFEAGADSAAKTAAAADSSAKTAVADDGRPDPPVAVELGDRPFLLYPAIAYRHKRHCDVIEAVSALPRFADLQVVFTGRRGPESGELDRLIAARGLQRRVHVLGRVPVLELDWLYRHATALVFPSEYEGFGNPALEAMSRGCPVVAADAGALPEVVGEAGLLFPVGDTGAMAEAVTRVVTEPELVADLVAAGRRRAGRFTPTMASQRLWSVYRDLLTAAPGDLRRRP